VAQATDSWASSPGVRSRMKQQRSADTRPELTLRRALHSRGLRYRLHRPIVPGTRRRVDIVFGPAKVAVDVRGCYWHGHDHEFQAYARTKNLDYWTPKIAGNRARDVDPETRLATVGWLLVVVWECDDPDMVADRIAEIVARRRVTRKATPDPARSVRC
jgi:DNA mismatch endonuclease (patch repair protein)